MVSVQDKPPVESTTTTALTRFMHKPGTVALCILVLYLLWLAMVVPDSHNGLDFVQIGRIYVKQGHGSTAIRLTPYIRGLANPGGFDGQQAYFIALDPAHARYYVDNAAYRYTRILYPLLARLFALGRAELIPYTLLIINWLAIGLGTLALASWLHRRGRSPWFALLYGLYPGLFVGLHYDLTEPLAFGLVAVAIWCADQSSVRGLLACGAILAAATLARESTIIFVPAVATLPLMRQPQFSRRTRVTRALVLLCLGLVPFVAYKGFLWRWLGSLGTPDSVHPVLIPLSGIFNYYPWDQPRVEVVRVIVAPALICLGLCVYSLARRRFSTEIALLLANILLFVVFLAPDSLNDLVNASRISTGVVLSALLCLPALDLLTRGNRWWLGASCALWLSPLPFWMLLPVAQFYL